MRGDSLGLGGRHCYLIKVRATHLMYGMHHARERLSGIITATLQSRQSPKKSAAIFSTPGRVVNSTTAPTPALARQHPGQGALSSPAHRAEQISKTSLFRGLCFSYALVIAPRQREAVLLVAFEQGLPVIFRFSTCLGIGSAAGGL